jgi:PAS domain S-box-containing protein
MERADSGGVFFEAVHIRKDGSSFPVEVSSKGTFINNELIRIHVIRDISERREAEKRILFLAIMIL